ncbi:MAG: class I tRNA ligase family protein, partial [Bacteroidales bacterium]|nr:class I tRNA ligase family protein [Bacteroidales bacterium]
DRFEVRTKISEELKTQGFMIKEEAYTNKVGFSERTNAVIEPKLSLQWYMKMKEMAKPALDIVMNDTVKFYPANIKNTYRHWMENVKDWNISRQLWWGQQIPVYYLPNKEEVVAKSAEEALQKAKKQYPELSNITIDDVKQDEDVLDTWFSSWLWPISVFDGIRNPDNKDIKYYYPTNDLVTAPEILFFWVARMIMSGLEYKQEIPFKNVYFTGIVRDKLGRKMSKSLGNSPDPIKLMEEYGADGVRVGMLLTSPAGNDLPFDESLCEQGRNFSNKIWNALRLIKGWEVADQEQAPAAKMGIDWINTRINKSLEIIDDHYSKYRLSDALMTTYKLIWDDFCSNYLEIIKPPYQKPIDSVTLEQTISIFEKLMKILHPFMPFQTEEIWHLLNERQDDDDIIISEMPTAESFDESLLNSFNEASDVINNIRKIRKEKGIPNKNSLQLLYINGDLKNHAFASVICKLGNIETFEKADLKPEASQSFMVKAQEYFIPLSENIDVEAEVKKLEEELKYQNGFLVSVQKKLSNERFVNNAPAKVVDIEKKKQADAEEKIQKIKEMIAGFQA